MRHGRCSINCGCPQPESLERSLHALTPHLQPLQLLDRFPDPPLHQQVLRPALLPVAPLARRQKVPVRVRVLRPPLRQPPWDDVVDRLAHLPLRVGAKRVRKPRAALRVSCLAEGASLPRCSQPRAVPAEVVSVGSLARPGAAPSPLPLPLRFGCLHAFLASRCRQTPEPRLEPPPASPVPAPAPLTRPPLQS